MLRITRLCIYVSLIIKYRKYLKLSCMFIYIYIYIYIRIIVQECCEKSVLFFLYYIYIYLKIKPNSVKIRFLSCKILVHPSTGFELTPLIHCSTIRLALRPAPYTTRPHPLPNIVTFPAYDLYSLRRSRREYRS